MGSIVEVWGENVDRVYFRFYGWIGNGNECLFDECEDKCKLNFGFMFCVDVEVWRIRSNLGKGEWGEVEYMCKIMELLLVGFVGLWIFK